MKRVLTDAVIARLEATGKQIGDAQAPEAERVGLDLADPYAVVYPDADAGYEGDIAVPQTSVIARFSVRYVGATRAQAEWMQDVARLILKDWFLDVAGFSTGPVQLEGSDPVERDDDLSPPLFYATDDFSVYVTPAT